MTRLALLILSALVLALFLSPTAIGAPVDDVSMESPESEAPKEGEVILAPLTEAELGGEEGRRKVPLKLLDAVRLGLERNVTLKKSLLDRATQRLDLSLAERLFEPEFYIKGRYQYEAENETDTRGLGIEVRKRLQTNGELTLQWNVDNVLDRGTNQTENRSTTGFTFRQPLLRNAGITVGTAPVVTAQYTEKLNLLSFNGLLMSQITSIQEAYWDLLLAMENRLSAIRSLEASKEVLARNKELIRAGRKAAADLVSAEQEVARNGVNVLNEEFAVESANRRLVNLLDLDNNVAVLPVEGFVYHEVEVDLKEMMQAALKYNPRLLSAAVNLQQSKLDLELARSAARDQVDIDVATGRTGVNEDLSAAVKESGDVGRGWRASLSVSIPLGLPRDRLKRDLTVAVRGVKKAKLDIKQERLSVLQEVRNRVNDVHRSLHQIQLAQESRKLALQKYKIERVRLELGRSTNFLVLSYQRDLTAARDQEHQAIATYLKSLARLDEVVGQALDTWNIKVETPVAPKIPSLQLDGLKVPPGLPLEASEKK
jgi:outer membrane protein TolC